MAREKSELARVGTAALPVAVLLPFVAALALGMSAVASSPRFSVAATFMVLASVFLVTFVFLTRRRLPRAGLLAACHALAWTPFLAVSASEVIQEHIVAGPQALKCGTGLMGLVLLVAPVAAVFMLVIGGAVGLLLARRGTDRAVRTVAVAATGLALVAFAFALPRIARPDPDTYLASLVTVGELRTDAAAQLAGRPFRYERAAIGDPLGGIPVPHPYNSDSNVAAVPRVTCTLTGLAEAETYTPQDTACPTLRIRIDRAADIALVERPEGTWAPTRIAFRPSDGARISISPKDVADHIGPPIGWTIGAGLGGLLGVGFIVAASRIRRRAAAFEGCEAKHVSGGWVELPSGESLRVDAAAPLPAGDVVLGNVREHMPTYRTTGAPSFGVAWPGTLSQLRQARTDLAASLDGLAIAAATLGATPLVVARVLGAF